MLILLQMDLYCSMFNRRPNFNKQTNKVGYKAQYDFQISIQGFIFTAKSTNKYNIYFVLSGSFKHYFLRLAIHSWNAFWATGHLRVRQLRRIGKRFGSARSWHFVHGVSEIFFELFFGSWTNFSKPSFFSTNMI